VVSRRIVTIGSWFPKNHRLTGHKYGPQKSHFMKNFRFFSLSTCFWWFHSIFLAISSILSGLRSNSDNWNMISQKIGRLTGHKNGPWNHILRKIFDFFHFWYLSDDSNRFFSPFPSFWVVEHPIKQIMTASSTSLTWPPLGPPWAQTL
jgi:hypothetical protein